MDRQSILRQIEESPIERWKTLRERDNGSLIALPNDDRLAAQLKGLTRHLQKIAPTFNEISFSPEDLALAYVARQLETGNVLLNVQNDDTRASEAYTLRGFAEQLDPAESSLTETFQAVADALTGKNEPVLKVITTGSRLFYLETGVDAAFRSKEEGMTDKDRALHLDLAANAFGNNFRQISPRVNALVGDIMRPLALDQDLWGAAMDDKERYDRSVRKVRAPKF
ncbi:MAG: hypothetical protein KDJ15_05345 [Alphaproteobacteria bacterium]|nr:hypothetical protein [Alphaproteobacteria bacterium]